MNESLTRTIGSSIPNDVLHLAQIRAEQLKTGLSGAADSGTDPLDATLLLLAFCLETSSSRLHVETKSDGVEIRYGGVGRLADLVRISVAHGATLLVALKTLCGMAAFVD